MAVNLTPQYLEAEAEYIRALERMRADNRERFPWLKDEPEPRLAGVPRVFRCGTCDCMTSDLGPYLEHRRAFEWHG